MALGLRCEESLIEQELKDIVVGEAWAELWHQLDISYPVNNGIVQNWDDMRMNVAGCHITPYLVDLLSRRGYAMNWNADSETVGEIKEKLCSTSYEFMITRGSINWDLRPLSL
ncbi:Actin-related protein [Parasponia andersonii]|uniref:Actin-related protein n=1 Tax=Parasponia andersonii TaxID=3476 RepID=A0A2P5CJN3_PARAD|nr:Actin-related protein [Parasponia andersonii]